MFNYFIQKKSTIQYPIKKYSQFDTIQRKYQLEIERIKQYYRHRDRAVNNNNMLSRLIDIISVDYNKPLVEIFKKADSSAKYISKQFNITSNLAIGEVHSNILYRENSSEIYLYVESNVDIMELETSWKDIVPVRLIYSNNIKFDYTFPYRQKKDTNTLTVFEIDIVSMVMQYTMWCKERYILDKSIDSNVYVATYVLPNIINQYMDLTIFNRLLALSVNNNLSTDITHRHPFHVVNYTGNIDNVLKGVIKDISNTNINIDQIIGSVPTFSGTDMFDILRITPTYYSTQSEWVLWITRIDYIYSLLLIMGKRGRASNLTLVNKLPVIFKIIERRASKLENVLPAWLIEQFNNKVEKIKEITGKR